jgi:hypothetical protein
MKMRLEKEVQDRKWITEEIFLEITPDIRIVLELLIYKIK